MATTLPAAHAPTPDRDVYDGDTTLIDIACSSRKAGVAEHTAKSTSMEEGSLTLARVVSRLKERRSMCFGSDAQAFSPSSSHPSDTSSGCLSSIPNSASLSSSLSSAPPSSTLPSFNERPASPSELETRYHSMTLLTLSARRSALDWRKLARYWEARARAAESGPSGVTPSASGVSDAAGDVPPLDEERLQAVRALVVARSISSRLLVGISLDEEKGEPVACEATSASGTSSGDTTLSVSMDEPSTSTNAPLSAISTAKSPESLKSLNASRPKISSLRTSSIAIPRRSAPVARVVTCATTRSQIKTPAPVEPRTKEVLKPATRQRPCLSTTSNARALRRPSVATPLATGSRKTSVSKPPVPVLSRIATASTITRKAGVRHPPPVQKNIA